MNTFYCIVYLIVTFTMTLMFFKFWGKNGLFMYIIINIILANIQTIKMAEILGLYTSLGNIAYGSVFLATDIINEKYGIKETQKIIKISFIAMIIFTLLMNLFLLFEPAAIDSSQKALELIFRQLPRITVASLIAYFISQNMDAVIYDFLKRKFNKIIISNNVSTIISQTFDTIIFTSLAFYGTMKVNDMLEIMLTMMLFKTIIALLDTPFMLIAKKIKNVNEL